MYDFRVRDTARTLLAGRATIVLTGAAPPPSATTSNS